MTISPLCLKMETARFSETLPTAQIHKAASPKSSTDINITVGLGIYKHELSAFPHHALGRCFATPNLHLKVRRLGFQVQFSE